MTSIRRQHVSIAGTVALFLVVPVALYWYAATRCFELACLGPGINAFIQVVTIVPLLVLWRTRRRLVFPVMIACAEGAMVFATLRRDFDFSPQFMLPAILIALVAGIPVGLAVERLAGRKR